MCYTVGMIETDKAYLAGLIDGEGYIGILKTMKGNKKHFTSAKDYLYCPIFKIAMTHKPVLEYLHSKYGGTLNTRKRQIINPKHKEAYDWVIKNRKVMVILDQVYPYMRVKKEEVEILRKFFVTNNGAGKPISEEHWKIRDGLYAEIRKLHYRGDSTVRD